MVLYLGIVIPIQEFFEAICMRETGTKDLEKLCSLLPHNNYPKFVKFLEEKKYIDYLEPYMHNSIGANIFSKDDDLYFRKIASHNQELNPHSTWKDYIFIGKTFYSLHILTYEELSKFIEKKIPLNINEITKEIEKLGLSKYEIHTFINLGDNSDLRLPNNYVPKYRKL